MRIVEQHCITGTCVKDKIVMIPELNRNRPATPQFIEMAGINVKLIRPTAFIYIDGTTVHQSEAGLTKGIDQYVVAIKGTSPYVAHQWCSTFENKEFLTSMEVVNGTCASAIQAIYRADQILRDPMNDAEEVIIIGHERITPDTVRLFKELRVDITCGDGFVYMRLERGHEIAKPVWKWAYNENPFTFTRETLNTLIPHYRIGYVKLHGTGTPSNDEAEADLAKIGTPLTYKPTVGHTQGISALLETCLILDDPNIRGRILVTANGLGGYYGAFTLTKPNARTEAYPQ
jgi:hypothetical protein